MLASCPPTAALAGDALMTDCLEVVTRLAKVGRQQQRDMIVAGVSVSLTSLLLLRSSGEWKDPAMASLILQALAALAGDDDEARWGCTSITVGWHRNQCRHMG